MGWKVLSADLPNDTRLLVQSYSSPITGFCVKLTDLSRIWSESLSRDEIIERASRIGSGVDPGEDEEQFKICVGKIESALNGENATSFKISSNEEQGQNLLLSLSAPLPDPLPPFKWTMYLQREPEHRIESELLSPLLLQADSLKQQIQQLVNQLHDKDRIISKICDRLETSGNDLTTVFPGVSNIKTSRKKTQREQLAKHVKGLQDFDENIWKQHQVFPDECGPVKPDTINSVFQDLPTPLNKPGEQQPTKWWQHLDRGFRITRAPRVTVKEGLLGNARGLSDPKSSSLNRDDNDPEHDQFQRQYTPPHLNHHSNDDDTLGHNTGNVETNQTHLPIERNAAREGDESTTDDDDDLDAPLKSPAREKLHSPIAEKQATASPRKIGLLGGRATQPSSTFLTTNTPSEPAEKPRPRSRLGAIGGKRENSVSGPVPSKPANVQATQTSSPSKSKLGAIGGKRAVDIHSPIPKAADEPLESSDDLTAGHARSSEKANTPPPRETSEERADRKRDQLKRDLEDKAKAPVKKKRKF